VKTVILAGGLGTRLAEETDTRPKPMVEIGGRPILWHIMNHYAHYGFSEFFVALGYKGEFIKRYFVDYAGLVGSMSVALARGTVSSYERQVEDWTVHLMDTGLHTNTGGRIGRMGPWLAGERFMVTYGDGVSDVDLHKLVAFHESHGRLITMTAVRPPARFGAVLFDGLLVKEFTEKPQVGEGWINGGFFICEPGVLNYLAGDEQSLEMHALVRLAAEGQLAAYRHEGFWQCMDTLRDKRLLEDLWVNGRAPWRMAA
jgi:glucose-1-phosphate cytidylyltransferase